MKQFLLDPIPLFNYVYEKKTKSFISKGQLDTYGKMNEELQEVCFKA